MAKSNRGAPILCRTEINNVFFRITCGQSFILVETSPDAVQYGKIPHEWRMSFTIETPARLLKEGRAIILDDPARAMIREAIFAKAREQRARKAAQVEAVAPEMRQGDMFETVEAH